MKHLRTLLGVLGAAAALPLAAQEPRIYALLSAVGDRFEVVHTKPTVGSHLPPQERAAYALGGNLLNRLVLQGLDRAVAGIDPDSRRIYLAMNPGTLRRGGPAAGELPEPVLAELRRMDRGRWDRLLVALPAYRMMANDGLGDRMQGLGIYAEMQCRSDTGFGNRIGSCENSFPPPSGPEALNPQGETVAANSFIAPYTFIDVFVLDPRTLAVLDRSTQYGHRKLADDAASARGIAAGEHDDFLARQIVAVVQEAAREAVEVAGLRGTVQVRERGRVEDAPAR